MPADSLAPAPDALAFLLSRRSRPAKLLSAPVPDRAALTQILTAALRVPDHGKLEPWRLVVLERAALARLAAIAQSRATELDLADDTAAKGVSQFAQSPLCVALIQIARPTDKAPLYEQTLSTGAVGLSLVNAALASGWGACWLTGWPAYDRPFCAQALGLTETETLAGFIHIGTAASAPPERPRPDLATTVTWAEA